MGGSTDLPRLSPPSVRPDAAQQTHLPQAPRKARSKREPCPPFSVSLATCLLWTWSAEDAGSGHIRSSNANVLDLSAAERSEREAFPHVDATTQHLIKWFRSQTVQVCSARLVSATTQHLIRSEL